MGVKSDAIVVVGNLDDSGLVKDWVIVIKYGLGLTIPIEDGIDAVGIKRIIRRINRINL